ncbi:ABC transporter permease [Thermoactinospora rubra]|uniref:ABC transporter permease n=1 Tax=Thermoactinospora rubra TaxID=1088767 RepID=UPI000A109007|nr:ABC transporter permease [Thermoactinospora rubra]
MRALLRLAWREARRTKGRSALIIALVALPVVLATGLLTGGHTADVSLREGLPSRLGSADAYVRATETDGPVEQDADGSSYSSGDPRAAPRTVTAREVAALLPGARLIPVSYGSLYGVAGLDFLGVLEADLRDPMTAGMRRLVEGRLPSAPDEVAVSPPLRGRDTLTTRVGTVRVVGVVEDPFHPRRPELVALPGSVLRTDERYDGESAWLADTPGPVLWSDVRRLNSRGLVVFSRAVIQNPPEPPEDEDPAEISMVVGIGVAIFMIVLETVLLAGPAFAVGLRRRRAELAMIAAQGGSARHLRAVVLADGLVLGGLAAVAGTGLGIVLGWALAWVLSRFGGALGPLEVPWWPVLGCAALGLASGVTAAIVPAVQAARQNTAAVLAGRWPQARARAGKPVLGLALLLAGIAATAAALRVGEVWIFAAMVLAVVGLVALMPWLVARSARATGRLPLPLRLAVRDASRHRVRTASAAAAVMAATTAVLAFGIGFYSNYVDNRDAYWPGAPHGTLFVGAWPRTDDARWASIKEQVARRLPGVRFVEAREAVGPGSGARVRLALWQDLSACPHRCKNYAANGDHVPIGDQRLLRLLQGRDDPAAAAAFARGRAVVFDRDLVRDGKLRLRVHSDGPGPGPDVVEVPAVLAEAAQPRQGGAVLPTAAVEELGMKTHERRLYAHYPADDDGLREALADAEVHLETGYENYVEPQLWVLFGAALFLVLGGTFVATRLAAADARPDLAIVHAIGGTPGLRRMMLAGQAGYIAGLGALTGAVSGAVTGVALAWPMTGIRNVGTFGPGQAWPGPAVIAVPWPFVAGVVIGLPLLAALVAGLCTRNAPPPLTRRPT